MQKRGIVVAALCAGVLVGCADADDQLSPDCRRAESALQPWGDTMPAVMSTLPPDVDPREPGEQEPDYASAAAREAKAADDIRARAAQVQSAELRARLNDVADAFDLLSRGRVSPAHPTTPSREYFTATTHMNEALHEIVTACPGIGDENVPLARRS